MSSRSLINTLAIVWDLRLCGCGVRVSGTSQVISRQANRFLPCCLLLHLPMYCFKSSSSITSHAPYLYKKSQRPNRGVQQPAGGVAVQFPSVAAPLLPFLLSLLITRRVSSSLLRLQPLSRPGACQQETSPGDQLISTGCLSCCSPRCGCCVASHVLLRLRVPSSSGGHPELVPQPPLPVPITSLPCHLGVHSVSFGSRSKTEISKQASLITTSPRTRCAETEKHGFLPLD